MSAGKGLTVILTGDGKGKTSAAFGMAMRARGRELSVAIIQFIKAAESGEAKILAERFPEISFARMGLGFVPPREDPDFPRHVGAARAALDAARAAMRSGGADMVILDEILYALALGLVEESDVAGLVESKPAGVHLVLTGRGATPRLEAMADIVTEMRNVKHPFDAGGGALPGIEF